MPQGGVLKLQTIQVTINKQTLNIGIPPTDFTQYQPNIAYMNTLEHSLLMEEYNTHDNTWPKAKYTGTKGTPIQQQLDTINNLKNRAPYEKAYKTIPHILSYRRRHQLQQGKLGILHLIN